jgi:DNA-binding response OmpR family regulator
LNSQRPHIRLALIDGDPASVAVLRKRLEPLGWELLAVDGQIPPDQLVAMKLNALIVDPVALGPDGWPYLERVCAAIPALGVIVHTTRSTVSQRVRGLRLGADDWVAKPCHPEELLARVEAVVRRRKRAAVKTEVGPHVAGELEIRADQFQAFISGESIGLTRREFELLDVLAEAQGMVVERERLYERVWGYSMAHGDRSVDVFVRKLRRKLQAHSGTWKYIHTHFGIGYRFEPEPLAGAAEASQPAQDPAQAAGSPTFHKSATVA